MRETRRKRNGRWADVAALALVGVVFACSTGADARSAGEREAAETAEKAAPAPSVVSITGMDFTFNAPATLTAGVTTIRFANQGPDMHHVQLVRLDEGKTADDLVAAFEAKNFFPAWARYVGGPNLPAPGETSEVTLDLEPGSYALICVIPGADGIPHVMKGMVKPIAVTPAAAPGAAEPAYDARIRLIDYGFDLAPALRAGRRTIRVENGAEQAHEIFIAQLAPGKTPDDLLAWIHEPEGPPPAKPIGGASFLASGEVNYVTADFAPGEYALICFVPDAEDGREHFHHGMVHQISVK